MCAKTFELVPDLCCSLDLLLDCVLEVIDCILSISFVPVLVLTIAYWLLVVLLKMRPFTLRPVIVLSILTILQRSVH